VKQNRPAVPEPPISRQLRFYLYLTAAVTGAAIMVVEILGAKMLSPFVGLSHFVWTAQIAVTLVALACGYYVGGRLADRSQQLHRLYGAIVAAAVYLAATVLICEPVAYWALDFSLPVGSLMASMILFFVPLALLAMTGPFLVRVITSSVSGVGGNVGRLTSISTLGSFAGTLCIGYVMIPLLPNSVTMYFTSGKGVSHNY
jgi:predicted membrane-bound spermidine synthase